MERRPLIRDQCMYTLPIVAAETKSFAGGTIAHAPEIALRAPMRVVHVVWGHSITPQCFIRGPVLFGS
jgi:hypothetical protein